MDNKTFFEKYGTALALLIGLVLIAGALMYGRGATMPTDGTGGEAVAVDIKDVKTEGSPFVGSADAPVTMAVWFDFQCSFCKAYESGTLTSVMTDYVADGKVRIVYKDFQFLGPASLETALYSRAVWDAYPDKWGGWFNAVMTGGGESTLARAGLDAAAVAQGMDAAQIATLLTANKAKYEAAIEADRAEGTTFGINGTPGSIVGTTLISGAQPYTMVKPLIDTELAK